MRLSSDSRYSSSRPASATEVKNAREIVNISLRVVHAYKFNFEI